MRGCLKMIHPQNSLFVNVLQGVTGGVSLPESLKHHFLGPRFVDGVVHGIGYYRDLYENMF